MVTKKKPQSSEPNQAIKEEHSDSVVNYDTTPKTDPDAVGSSSSVNLHHMSATGASYGTSGGGATVDIKIPQHTQSSYITGPAQSAYVPYGASAQYYQDYNSYSRSVSEFYDSWKLPIGQFP